MMTKYKFYAVMIAAISMTIFTSCKKEGTSDLPADTPTGTVLLHMHTNIADVEVDSGDVAEDADGRHFQLDLAQFYISNVQLKKSDGTWITVNDALIMKTIEEEEYVLGKVPAGNYLTVKFDVGVGTSANALPPSSYASSHPLSDENMWFGSSAQGHIFMYIKGMAAANGQTAPVDQPFSYKLGTTAMLTTITMPDQAFSVVADNPQVVHLNADYGAMLHDVDFQTYPTATPFANGMVALLIAANLQDAFTYE